MSPAILIDPVGATTPCMEALARPRFRTGPRTTDTLDSSGPEGYRWSMTGIDDLTGFDGELFLGPAADNGSRLTLRIGFDAASAAACVAGVGAFTWIAGALPDAFSKDVGLTPVA